MPSKIARGLTLAYGALAYLVFFLTFLYAIAFVAGWTHPPIIPKTINDGAIIPIGYALAINAALLAVFVVQHTVMARRWFKAWITRFIPKAAERSTYVLASSLALILIFWLWRPMPAIVWDAGGQPLRIAITAIYLLGWLTVLYGSFLIDHFDLFGLRQVVLYAKGRSYTSPHFVERSLYRVVRHPLMLGFIIAFWAAPTMTVGRLFFAMMTTAYILVGTRIEERDLERAHPEAYPEYRRRVRGLLPLPKRKAAHTA